MLTQGGQRFNVLVPSLVDYIVGKKFEYTHDVINELPVHLSTTLEKVLYFLLLMIMKVTMNMKKCFLYILIQFVKYDIAVYNR